jgi:hypothetical protein
LFDGSGITITLSVAAGFVAVGLAGFVAVCGMSVGMVLGNDVDAQSV